MKKINFVSIPFPKEFDREVRIAAARQLISRSELIRRAVRDYLNQIGEKQNPMKEQQTNGEPS